jgi:hypothetical protein
MCKQISISLLFLLPLLAARTSFGEIKGDIELLKVVADGYEANLAKLRTWQGQASITSSVSMGSGQEAVQRQGKYKADFLVDRTQNAVRWTWFTLEETEHKEGQKITSDLNPMAGISKGNCDYVLFYSGYGQRGERRNLNIYPRDHWPKNFQGLGFDPLGILKEIAPIPIPEMLRFYYEQADSPKLSPTTIFREGDIVTFQSGLQGIINRHVFDLAKGCSVLEYYNSSPGHGETHWKLDYEKLAGVFVIKSVSLVYEHKRPDLKGTSTRMAVLTNAMVNAPIDQAEFSLGKLGLKPGDPIRDTRTNMEYIFGEKGATETDMPPKIIESIINKPLPTFYGIQTDFTIDQAKGRMILVCFFDMNQRPSRNCIMELAKQAEHLKQKGVSILAVQAAQAEESALKEWVKKYNIPFPVGAITADVEKTRFAWRVHSLPWLILAERNHIVQAEGFGIDELSARLNGIGKQSSAKARVFGTVRDAAGNPLEEADIRIVPALSSLCRSNAEGRFEVEYEPEKDAGPETDYYLSARHDARNLAAHLIIDENAGSIDLRLDPAVTLTATVVDTEGRYVVNAEVTVWIRGANWKGSIAYDTVRTDSHGRFRVGALPREINITDMVITATGYCQHFVSGRDLSIAAENPVVLKTITLYPANLSVSGIVVDESNRPVSGATVKVLGGCEPRSDTLTDADGRFRVDKLGAGGIRVIVRHSDETILEGQIDCRAGESNVKVVLSEIGRAPRPPKSLVNGALPAFDNMGIDFDIRLAKRRAVLVCFFDLNQRPSRHSITELAKKAAGLKEQGVCVIAVEASEVDENTLNEWVKKNSIPFPMGAITGDIDRTRFTWGVRSLPWLVLTNRDHIVRAEGFGIDQLDEELKKIIDTVHAIEKNNATAAKPVAQTRLSDPAKSFLDVAAILKAWESTYGGIRTIRVSYSHRLVDYRPPANNPDEPAPVAYSHVERVEHGERYHIRYSTAEDAFDMPQSLMEHAFDGKTTREYWGQTKSGRIVPGPTGRDVENKNHLKDYMLLDAQRIRSYLDEYPNGVPTLVLLFRELMSSAVVRPNLESVAGQLCHAVEVSDVRHENKYLLWLAHDKGMCLMRYQSYHNNKLEREIEVEQIAMAKTDTAPIWYPVKAHEAVVTNDVGAWKNELTVKEFVPNVKVGENTFRFDFPKGTYIVDRIRDMQGLDLPEGPPSLVGKLLPKVKHFNLKLDADQGIHNMILVSFFDMQQRPSRNCITQVADRAEQLKAKGVIVGAVQASEVDENTLNEWVKQYNIPFPVGIVQGNAEKVRFAWGVRSLPWLILTDSDHVVRAEGFNLNDLDDKIKESGKKLDSGNNS